MPQDAVIELAKELMAKPSITPNDAGCLTLISSRLSKLGFVCESLPFNGVDNLWARLGTDSPLVVFAGHTDVVPTGPIEKWTTPPFVPTEREGFLYGRGACDMKAGIAAMVVAAEVFLKQHPRFQGSIAFLLTSDEEGPSHFGTKKVMEILKARGVKIDYCIIGEPSSIEQLGDQIRIGRRGSMHGTLTFYGKQGHVAHPQYAINPIHFCASALDRLANEEWDKGNSDFPPTSFQMTNIHSGTGARNIIPGTVEVLFNFRYGTAITTEALQARTIAILDKTGLKYSLEWEVSGLPFLTKRGVLINTVQEVIRNVCGRETQLSTGGGTSDGRFIAPTGAEVVELGVSHATAHHIDECVRSADLPQLALLYQGILEKLSQ